MRCVGQQGLVTLDELLDMTGRSIETRGQSGNFVAALDGDSGREVACAERFNTALQTLETPADLPHERIGRHADRQRQQYQHEVEYRSRMPVSHRHAGHYPATVG